MPSALHGTVLVVEDNEEIARAYERAIGKFACVVVVGTVREGRAAVDAVRFDLAVLDVLLPDGSGVEVARRLRMVQGPGVPIYVISALSEREARKEFAGVTNATFHGKTDIVDALQRRFGVAGYNGS